ncbi:MAG: pilus assembly protein N-terminal domain-containing protein [Candidatus Eremiobacteraeota bacterium]|nr:pilus assembly protein N-terminal domain-containing protein [Candidatus Eremiobacteraeota bacterium]
MTRAALASLLAAASLLTCAAPGGAQESLTLATGQSATLDAQGLSRVAVGDSKIAGVLPIGTRAILVNGKAPGRTTLLVWTAGGQRTYELNVVEQTIADVARLVRGALPDQALHVEQVGRSLVVSGAAVDQQEASRVSDVLNRFGAMAKDAKFTLVDNVTVAHQLGTLEREIAQQTDARDVRVDYDAKGNVIVSGHVRDRAAAEAVLQRVRGLAGANLAADGKIIDRLVLDVVQQVSTRVTVLEVDKTALSQIGLRLQSASVNPGGQVSYGDPSFPVFDNPGATGPNGETLPNQATGRALVVNRFIRAAFLAPTIDLLVRNGNARILSSPDLLTMPGSQAQFLVGGEIPYVVSTGLGAVNVQYKEYGVRLNVLPTILASGGVESKITPEVSDLDFQDAAVVNGFLLPAFKTSRITTDVVTKPGESIVMAGLLRRVESKNIDKIPGLGDLPVIGSLFRSTRYQKQETDVVFVMTPEIVTR